MVLKLVTPDLIREVQECRRGRLELKSRNLAEILGGEGHSVTLPKGVIEISGEPGAGKTQLCLELAASNAWNTQPGASESLVIDTEHCWSASRVQELCLALDVDEDVVLSKVHILRLCDPVELTQVLCGLPEFLKFKPDINLLIIDSIAFPARLMLRDYNRNKLPAHIVWADMMNRLSYNSDIAIVVTNHLTSAQLTTGDFRDVVCLGPTWGQRMSTRLFVQRDAILRDSDRHLDYLTIKCTLLKSVSTQVAFPQVSLKILPEGVCDLETADPEQLPKKRRFSV